MWATATNSRLSQSLPNRGRRGRLDWFALNAVDADLIARTGDVEALQSVLDTLAFADLTDPDIQRSASPSIVKVMRLQQLVIEYLLQSQEDLVNEKSQLESASSSSETRHRETIQKMQQLENELGMLKRTDRNQRRTIAMYEQLLSSGQRQVSVHRCSECSKTFATQEFLLQHQQRRHPGKVAAAALYAAHAMPYEPQQHPADESIMDAQDSTAPAPLVAQAPPVRVRHVVAPAAPEGVLKPDNAGAESAAAVSAVAAAAASQLQDIATKIAGSLDAERAAHAVQAEQMVAAQRDSAVRLEGGLRAVEDLLRRSLQARGGGGLGSVVGDRLLSDDEETGETAKESAARRRTRDSLDEIAALRSEMARLMQEFTDQKQAILAAEERTREQLRAQVAGLQAKLEERPAVVETVRTVYTPAPAQEPVRAAVPMEIPPAVSVVSAAHVVDAARETESKAAPVAITQIETVSTVEVVKNPALEKRVSGTWVEETAAPVAAFEIKKVASVEALTAAPAPAAAASVGAATVTEVQIVNFAAEPRRLARRSMSGEVKLSWAEPEVQTATPADAIPTIEETIVEPVAAEPVVPPKKPQPAVQAPVQPESQPRKPSPEAPKMLVADVVVDPVVEAQRLSTERTKQMQAAQEQLRMRLEREKAEAQLKATQAPQKSGVEEAVTDLRETRTAGGAWDVAGSQSRRAGRRDLSTMVYPSKNMPFIPARFSHTEQKLAGARAGIASELGKNLQQMKIDPERGLTHEEFTAKMAALERSDEVTAELRQSILAQVDELVAANMKTAGVGSVSMEATTALDVMKQKATASSASPAPQTLLAKAAVMAMAQRVSGVTQTGISTASILSAPAATVTAAPVQPVVTVLPPPVASSGPAASASASKTSVGVPTSAVTGATQPSPVVQPQPSPSVKPTASLLGAAAAAAVAKPMPQVPLQPQSKPVPVSSAASALVARVTNSNLGDSWDEAESMTAFPPEKGLASSFDEFDVTTPVKKPEEQETLQSFDVSPTTPSLSATTTPAKKLPQMPVLPQTNLAPAGPVLTSSFDETVEPTKRLSGDNDWGASPIQSSPRHDAVLPTPPPKNKPAAVRALADDFEGDSIDELVEELSRPVSGHTVPPKALPAVIERRFSGPTVTKPTSPVKPLPTPSAKVDDSLHDSDFDADELLSSPDIDALHQELRMGGRSATTAAATTTSTFGRAPTLTLSQFSDAEDDVSETLNL